MSHPPLTPVDVTTLAKVVALVATQAKVRWTTDEDGDIRYGTARHFVSSATDFSSTDADLRDRWLRITTDTGFDAALSVAWLMEHPGYFAAV